MKKRHTLSAWKWD